MEFTSSCCLVKDRVKQEVLLRGTLFNGLYRLSLPSEHTALLGEITPAYIWVDLVEKRAKPCVLKVKKDGKAH